MKCRNVKNIKKDFCPDCGAEVREYGFKDGTRLIGDKKKYHKTLKKSLEGGFLICDTCGGYYELQPGESLDDFADECECGGKLKYLESVEGIEEDIKEPQKPTQEQEETPKTPPGRVSKGKPHDLFNKQSGRTKTAMGLGICCLGIILIIGVVGLMSGGTGKAYNDNFISFNHPSSWEIAGGNIINGGESIEGKGERQYFIFEIHPLSADYPSDLNQWQNLVTNELGELGGTVEKTGTTTIDANNAVYIIYKDEEWYYLVKGNMAYQFMFRRTTMSDSEIEDIVKTIKIK